MPVARSITRILTSPGKVAQSLDWRKVSGSVLSMRVAADKIELAIASHPSFEEPLQQLASIPLKMETADNKKVLKPEVVQELSKVVKDFNVCGMVVSWPVQKEGWCGASCGRVLHTLDQIISQSDTVLSPARPVCLWDEEHNVPHEDEWGRNATYSKISNKTCHQASKEQYGDHNSVAVDVWNDFVREHWPDLYQQQPRNKMWNSEEDTSASRTIRLAWTEGRDERMRAAA